AAGLECLQHDNCFPYIANWTKAQRLMDRQLKIKWPKLLNGIARQLHPIHGEIFRKHPISYYWPTYQHEWPLRNQPRRVRYPWLPQPRSPRHLLPPEYRRQTTEAPPLCLD